MASKRSRLLIDKAVQGTVAWRFLMHWVTLSLALFVLCAFLQLLTDPFRTPAEHLRALLREQGKTFGLLLLLTPMFVWDSIKLSHRFAGPVSRLRRGMEGLANGEDVPPMNFRRGDFWQELAGNFNRIRERLQTEASGSSGAANEAVGSETIGNETIADDSIGNETIGNETIADAGERAADRVGSATVPIRVLPVQECEFESPSGGEIGIGR